MNQAFNVFYRKHLPDPQILILFFHLGDLFMSMINFSYFLYDIRNG